MFLKEESMTHKNMLSRGHRICNLHAKTIFMFYLAALNDETGENKIMTLSTSYI